ncbi:monovalent cation/H+ antiporter subunit A [Phyllobacterium phragmitis]|uniref:Monovalent cation/H+ antiporter subunit A n=1 Tax=Phyllobacterium phragmitis TaxID=2670329 RepID=A0A2S9IYM1_9HYPH|nr:monovalent cation/H+ antiporter subunit A [Phyllobacterium phragmitis]PRD45617.1 monovalent cation/H+ antiporter subunit A [Phyllobacterium phragmitis]
MEMGGGMLILLMLLPFAGSVLVALFRSNARNVEAWFAGAVAVAGLILAILLYPSVADGGVVRSEIQWLPAYGLNFTLRMDGFAWMFAMLVTGIGLLVVVYARYYMSSEDYSVPRFFSFFLAFMGAMLGIVLSGNLILLVVFWELTGIFSFLLIGYWYQNASARDGARMALTVTGIGGLGLLVGVLLLGHIVGSYDLDKVLASGNIIRLHPLYLPAMLLILLGALTKSAQFPFHFWLPNAMSAPTPVSAYLHSATMVKAGVFLLARFWPVFAGTEEWFWVVGVAGLSSLVLGAFFALFQQDMKGLLAYSTISHLGLITVLLSLGSPLAAVAAIFHMMNHATFKASLFMAAGVIDHETGTRDMRRLSGLFRYMPFTATLAMVASAAMAGVPLLNGFISKEMFFAETVETHLKSTLDTVTPYLAVVAGLLSVAYSLRFIHSVFFGPPPRDLPREPHEPPQWMRFPIEFLVLACLVVGIVPGLTVGPYLHAAVVGVLGPETPPYSLAVWHGFTVPLLMSAVALAGGVLLYFMLRNYLATSQEGPPYIRHIAGNRIFERILVTLSWRWARLAEAFLGTRRLQPQLRLLVLIALIAGSLPLYRAGAAAGILPTIPVDPVFAFIWLLGAICAVGAAVRAKFHRLSALILLGGAGLVTCITFAWLSAPDLALTQLLVEIVTTVLILLGLRWLPKRRDDPDPMSVGTRARIRRYRDLALAVAGGVGMSFLAYMMMTRPATRTLGDYFLRYAYTEGGGRNVVNVILVDFRGFDTFGEIAVLGVVSLSAFALLRRFRPAADNVEQPHQQKIQDAYDEARPDRQTGDTLSDYLSVPSVIMHWLFPVIIVLAVHLFLRGHDLPGGGFAAGVALAIAFILQYLAAGTRWVEDRLRILPLRWIGVGLLSAALTGMGSWLFGYPFLTSHSQYADLPLIGKIPLASALLFDLGVFLLVVGATVLVLIALAHQSIRSHRTDRFVATLPKEDA